MTSQYRPRYIYLPARERSAFGSVPFSRTISASFDQLGIVYGNRSTLAGNDILRLVKAERGKLANCARIAAPVFRA